MTDRFFIIIIIYLCRNIWQIFWAKNRPIRKTHNRITSNDKHQKNSLSQPSDYSNVKRKSERQNPQIHTQNNPPVLSHLVFLFSFFFLFTLHNAKTMSECLLIKLSSAENSNNANRNISNRESCICNPRLDETMC